MSKQTNITVTGVDIGSSTLKIAAVVKGGVEVIVNQANMRETPNVVGLGPKQRQIGELGKLKIKSNHANTIVAPSRLLGFHYPCAYTSSQLNFTPAKLQKPVNQIVFSVQQDKNLEKFTSQQLVAALITEIQKTISQTNEFQNRNLVFAVPGYFTQHERKAMMDAIHIARKGIKNDYSVQLVSEQVATSMDYGYGRRSQFSQETQSAKNVLFIDFGHSKCNIFLTAFNKQYFRIISNTFDRQLGCKFMDWQILKFYASQFDSKNNHLPIQLMQSKKAVQKILQRIQKQRKILSGVNEADLNVECLLEGEDFYYSLTRQKFEQLCSSIIERFRQLLSRFLEQLKQKGIKVDSVELVGGGTRIPAILNAVSNILGEEPSRTLNSSECIAKGAALLSAINSTIFRAQPFDYVENSKYNINLIVNGTKYGQMLIERNQTLIGREKIFQIQVQEDVQKLLLSAQYDQGQIEQGLERKIFEVQLAVKQKKRKRSSKSEKIEQMKEEQKESQKSNKVLIHLTMDPSSSLISFQKATSQSLALQTVKVNNFEYFNQQQLSIMQEHEKEMTIRDLKIKKFYHKKNQFQSTCYKLRDQLDNTVQTLKQYTQQNQEKEVRQMIEKEVEFLQNIDLDQIDHTDQLSKRQNALLQKVHQFITSINSLKNQYQILNEELKQLSALIENLISTRQPNHYPERVNQVGQWINSIFQKLQNSPKYLSPPVTAQQVKQVKNNLQNQVKQYDQEMQRRRAMSSREGTRTRQQNQHFNPTGTFFRPQTGFNPLQGRSSNNPYSQFDDRNKSRYNPGGFWDGGFF